MTARERALVALALLGAIGWGVLAPRAAAPSPLWPLKGVAVAALALLAAGRRRDVAGAALLATALAAHATGDLLLARAPFLAGVAAFAVGHLLLVALFWRHRIWWDDVTGGPKLRLGVLALAGALLLFLLRRGLAGPLTIAVPLYALALLAMAGMAQVARRGQPWVALGAIAFVLSDALLALGRFRHLAAGDALVWPLYAAAQLAITLGWLYGSVAPSPSAETTD